MQLSQSKYSNKYRSIFVILGKSIFFLASIVLFTLAFREYIGDKSIYILFTLMSYLLLWLGFRVNAFFFDTFIGIFLWLGFWLKLSVRVAFMDGKFNQAVGGFDGSGAAFDQSLLIVSCGFFGLILASFVREKWLFNYPDKMEGMSLRGVSLFYKKYRKSILIGFVVFLIFITVSNVYLGIYQRGGITQTILPFGLNGVYKWLLIFGLASFVTLILKFEYIEARKTTYLVALISLLELFLSNVSLLSRGMVLNGSAIVYGMYISVKRYGVNLNIQFFIKYLILFILLLQAR